MFVTNPSADESRGARTERQPERAFEAAVQGSSDVPEGVLRSRHASRENRETYVAQVDFVLRDSVPNEFVRVNPLGLQIAYFRVDQAFEEGRR
jgi:hypothetical protein